MPHQYPPEFRQRALQLLDAMMEASEVSEFEAIKSVASKLNISEKSVRRWRRKVQFDAGTVLVRPVSSTPRSASSSENLELRTANEILKSASAFLAAEFDCPATK